MTDYEGFVQIIQNSGISEKLIEYNDTEIVVISNYYYTTFVFNEDDMCVNIETNKLKITITDIKRK
jgi:hypothetical protein